MTRFPPQVPMPFSREVVDDIDDGQVGCYGLFAGPGARECVYIGKGELRARMLGHLDGDNAHCRPRADALDRGRRKRHRPVACGVGRGVPPGVQPQEGPAQRTMSAC